jgi:hypothetical protein
MRWRWKLQFRESLIRSPGLVPAVPAHWSEVARKSDRHAGSWGHGKSCTRSEGLSGLSETIAKGGLFKEDVESREILFGNDEREGNLASGAWRRMFVLGQWV